MKNLKLLLLAFLCITITVTNARQSSLLTQDDTVLVQEVSVAPVFDGIGNDICWQSADWQIIDQVWIPWGTTMQADDFSGRYKVTWSSSSNLLYFILEITDDVVSDAYDPGVTAAIYNFDMFEVFIDENKSGGYHVFDGTADNEASMGLNAENAFAYHIFTAFPASGATADSFRVEDMGGTDWGHSISKIYNDHFPNFILRKEGNVNTWEFSLIVYDDTYSDSNIEGSRVTLASNKVMGLSIAYNDDDEPGVDPSMTVRDNFIGSVAVTEAAYNDHWKNARDFGPLKLIHGTTGLRSDQEEKGFPVKVFPNPASSNFTVQVTNDYIGQTEMTLYNLQGDELISLNRNKEEMVLNELVTLNYQPGIYIIELICGQDRYCCPLVFTY